MKIVFLIRTLTYGGAERQLVALATALTSRGHDVSVMVFYGGGPLEADLAKAGVPVIALGKRGRWDMPGFFVRLARALRAERADVIHGYLGGANILALLAKPIHRSKVVWGVRASDIDMSTYHWISRVDDTVGAWLSRYPDLIIANSHAGKRYIAGRGFPAAKIIVIPNGIDVDRFRPLPAERNRVRAELGLSAEDVLIGRVGRIAPQKDYPTFLRAAAVVSQHLPEARFACVGSGPDAEREALIALARDLGIADRVIWTGARGDMEAVYNALDISVSSSAYGEGTPNVVAEAMACGVPCVVTDAGDCAITVGDAGHVVPPRDPDALAHAIVDVAAARARGEIDPAAVRARIVQHLSIEQLLHRSEHALLTVRRGRKQVRALVNEAGA